MDEEQKQKYLEKYHQAKQKGVKFWPDIIYKDLLVSFAIFLLLVGLATFLGVANEPKADPSDSAYIPRPEWYFLFLFQMLKYFPGNLEWVGTVVVPGIAVAALFLLPFLDRNPRRHWSGRKIAISVMSLIVIGIVALTIIAAVTTPTEAAGPVASTLSEQILSGGDLFSVQCVSCHGADGEGGEVKGVKGLEGFIMKSIRSQDEMYTRTDDTLVNIVAMGQPDRGMQPFSKAYGGELGPGDIQSIVTFMRYTWDDRAELPKEVTQALAFPPLGPNEVPSYEVHISVIFKRYCISCHRAAVKNQNNMLDTYDNILKTGDHAPNLIPGDLDKSNLILMIRRQKIEAGGAMPPNKALSPDLVRIIELWVAAGAPNSAADAAKLTPPPPTPTPAP